MKFFVSKYPVIVYETDGPKTLDVGTIFTVTAINGNMFEMAPASQNINTEQSVMVDALMLERGFNEQDNIAN